jgi:uncharacterized protein (DUF4415 family)
MPNAKKMARYSKKDLREVSDNPELTKEDFARAKPFSEVFPDLAASIRKGRGPNKAPTKKLVSLRLSPEVIEHFKSTGRAGNRGSMRPCARPSSARLPNVPAWKSCAGRGRREQRHRGGWCRWRVEAIRWLHRSKSRNAPDRIGPCRDGSTPGPGTLHADTSCHRYFGSNQASVTAVSMMCRSTLLHCGHVKVRRSLPVQLGSIADNFMGEPQAVHCGPWFCLSSMALPSVWRSEFPGKPTGRLRCDGVGCNDVDFHVIAPGAFEQPVFETKWPRRNAFQHHPRLAAGTARALNSGQELWG